MEIYLNILGELFYWRLPRSTLQQPPPLTFPLCDPSACKFNEVNPWLRLYYILCMCTDYNSFSNNNNIVIARLQLEIAAI